ncbi:MAG: DUF1501 domain-containing protein [Planctomycetes bacterium]|nr:DUF1501 domain-containing protein [Planctomycetota bacterium]
MTSISRRDFLAASSAAAFAPLLPAMDKLPKGKADSVIMLWLGGGAAHMDTFDPKRKGDAKAKKAGSYYDPIDTAVKGIQVCEHLKQTAKVMDRVVLLRGINHDVIDEHAAAVNRMHTGRPIAESVLYPSMGSVITSQLGPRSDKVPPYVVIGYPNVTRGPGFLGAKNGYVYLFETDSGPNGLTRPADVDAERQARREALLAKIREQQLKRHPGEPAIQEYATAAAEGFKLAGPDFMKVFNLKTESADLRNEYGGEFGQRCLLARRLVQSGVRFVEVSFNLNFVNGTGWDTHNEGQLNQHLIVQQLDQALGALITDLERCKRLDKTLIVVNTEFGRPPEFDGGGGRGHQSKAFSTVLAGGGLKTGQAIGVTDEIAKKIIDRPISVPDFFATIYHAMGIDTNIELSAGERPVPITDGGKPIKELFV